MSLLQQIAENLGATGATGASWMHTIAIQEGATGPVGGSWIQAWADAVGVTGPIGGSWIQALADHYGVTGAEGDWLIGIEVGTSGGGGEAPVNTVAPAITGTTETGETLSCSEGSWTGTAIIIYTYQWKRNGSPIGSATNSSYVLVSGDVGTSVKCTVTATNDIGATNADSNTVTPTAPWDPSQLTGLWDWWTATTGVNMTGVSVDSWTGYNSNVLLPFAGGTKAEYIASDANFNNEPSVLFNPNYIDGGDYSYYIPVNSNTTSKCIFMVAKLITKITGDTSDILALGSSSSPRFAMFSQPGNPLIDIYADNGGYDTVGGSYVNGDYVFIRQQYNRSTGLLSYYSSTTNSFTNLIGTFSVSANLNYINGNFSVNGYSGQYGGTGKTSVVEVISMDALPTPTEITQLQTYIQTKYGI